MPPRYRFWRPEGKGGACNPIMKMATLVSGRPQHNFTYTQAYRRSSCLFPRGYYIQQATRQGVARKLTYFSRACGTTTIRSDPLDGKSGVALAWIFRIHTGLRPADYTSKG